ncbi:MAG: YiiX family permuted papain-like enzyme [Candidatus Adiutrix sp.]|jgi:hypothetical protein|nr:YiiX family permuted papain-like enzyme [Candidatus Adiutrix sp.]
MSIKFFKRPRVRLIGGLLLLLGLLLAGGGFYLLQSGGVTAEELAQTQFLEGDLIFQPSTSRQSLAIQLATQSKYSHCGIVFKKNGQLYVYEALADMTWTPLQDWVNRGVQGHYVLMRLKNRDQLLTSTKLDAMKEAGLKLSSKTYDLLFQWSDDKIYCSELVWKIYDRGAGIPLTPLRTFKDYDLDSEIVQTLIKKRFGSNFSLSEKVVAPSDLMQSHLLETVGGN